MVSGRDLPNELLGAIANFVSPGDIVSFASTCTRFREISRDALALYRQRLNEMGLVQDLDAYEVPRVLRSIIRNPELSWYPRKSIFYARRINRQSWTHIRPFVGCEWDSDEEEVSNDGPVEIEEDPLAFFSETDFAFIRDSLRKLHMPHEMVAQWISEIQSGSQEPVKCILAILCPKLHTLVVTQNSSDYGRARKNCINHFVQAIEENLKLQHRCPVEIFEGLQHVDLQHKKHFAPYEFGDDQYSLYDTDALAFLSLPNIKSLGMNVGMNGIIEKPTQFEKCWRFGERTSTIGSLHLFACRGTPTITSMIGASKELKHIREVGDADVIKALHRHASSSLETLKLSKSDGIFQERPESLLLMRDFTSLKTLHLTLADVMTSPSKTSSPPSPKHTNWKQPRAADATRAWVDLRSFVPKSLERLIFFDGYP